MIELTRLT